MTIRNHYSKYNKCIRFDCRVIGHITVPDLTFVKLLNHYIPRAKVYIRRGSHVSVRIFHPIDAQVYFILLAVYTQPTAIRPDFAKAVCPLLHEALSFVDRNGNYFLGEPVEGGTHGECRFYNYEKIKDICQKIYAGEMEAKDVRTMKLIKW
jgi:hypothetical protein